MFLSLIWVSKYEGKLVDWRHYYLGLVPSCYMLSQEVSSDPRAQTEQDSKFANSKEQDFLIFF